MKKNELSEVDKDIVKALLLEIKPDQMFVAGDLADPHGTHKVCLDAVLAAIDEVKDEEWMKNCRVWMYRGAWAEWEMDHIEMAVPISPEAVSYTHLELGKVYDYKVKYSEYVVLRRERREQQQRAYENQQKKLADTEAFIERFRYKATKSVQVQSRIKQDVYKRQLSAMVRNRRRTCRER